MLSLAEQTKLVLSTADGLSLPFCHLKLRAIVEKSKSLSHEEAAGIWSTVSASINSLLENGSSIVFQLISGLNPEIGRKVRGNFHNW
jgi:hypothetical protein